MRRVLAEPVGDGSSGLPWGWSASVGSARCEDNVRGVPDLSNAAAAPAPSPADLFEVVDCPFCGGSEARRLPYLVLIGFLNPMDPVVRYAGRHYELMR